MKEENGQNYGNVHSVNYGPSPIAAGGLKIPLILDFKSSRYITHIKMKESLTSLYSFDYTAKETEPSSEEEKEEINLLLQESSESNSGVAKPEKKEKPPMINELSASECDSEVDKEEENVLEDDHYDAVIEKQIYH